MSADLAVVFGKAASVSRSASSHVSGQVWSEGDRVAGRIRTDMVHLEQGVIVTETGREFSVRAHSAEQLMREGGEYALLIFKGKPIMIGGVNSDAVAELDLHPEDVRNHPPGNTFAYLAFPFFVVALLAAPGAYLFLTEQYPGTELHAIGGAASFILAVTFIMYGQSGKMSWRSQIETEYHDRTEFLRSGIETYRSSRAVA